MRRTGTIAGACAAVGAAVAISGAPTNAAAEPRVTGPEGMTDGGLLLGVVREQRDDIWELMPTAGIQLLAAVAPVRVRVAGAAAGRHVDVAVAPELTLALWRNDVSVDVAGGLGARLELRWVTAARSAVTGYVGGRRLVVSQGYDPAVTMAGGLVLQPGGGTLRYGAEFAYTDRTGGGVMVWRDGQSVDGPQPWYLTTFFVGLGL